MTGLPSNLSAHLLPAGCCVCTHTVITDESPSTHSIRGSTTLRALLRPRLLLTGHPFKVCLYAVRPPRSGERLSPPPLLAHTHTYTHAHTCPLLTLAKAPLHPCPFPSQSGLERRALSVSWPRVWNGAPLPLLSLSPEKMPIYVRWAAGTAKEGGGGPVGGVSLHAHVHI